MVEFVQTFWGSIMELGVEHNVSPVLFAILYVASLPPYMGSMVWAVQNHRTQKAVALPIMSTLFFFILPALYVLIFGKNVAWWVYLIIMLMIGYGSYSVYKKFKIKTS